MQSRKSSSISLLKLAIALISYCSVGSSAYGQTTFWTNDAPMNTGRVFHTMTTLNDGRVLVTGGLTPQSAADSSAEIYAPQARGLDFHGLPDDNRARRSLCCQATRWLCFDWWRL